MRVSLRTIASRLRAQAYRIGRTTVGRLLRKLGFGLVANRKSLTGAAHPDRNRQFDYIRRVRQQFLRAGYPVISVDTKNKELVGNFANKGRTWRQTPAQVNLHDFPGDALGRAVPYGIYDILHNQGYVYLGNSYDTPEFAVHARLFTQTHSQHGLGKDQEALKVVGVSECTEHLRICEAL